MDVVLLQHSFNALALSTPNSATPLIVHLESRAPRKIPGDLEQGLANPWSKNNNAEKELVFVIENPNGKPQLNLDLYCSEVFLPLQAKAALIWRPVLAELSRIFRDLSYVETVSLSTAAVFSKPPPWWEAPPSRCLRGYFVRSQANPRAKPRRSSSNT